MPIHRNMLELSPVFGTGFRRRGGRGRGFRRRLRRHGRFRHRRRGGRGFRDREGRFGAAVREERPDGVGAGGQIPSFFSRIRFLFCPAACFGTVFQAYPVRQDIPVVISI